MKNSSSVPKIDANVIDVDRDFDGNIQQAIDSASDGDVVQLGDRTYKTDGLAIDSDITLQGGSSTVIDGNGTNNPVIELGSEADGASILDLSVTDANIGIKGERASDVTLNNLDVSNIGISNPIGDGQNNSGILFGHASGLKISNVNLTDIGRKGIGIGDTDGAYIENVSVQNVNLAAEHAQSHDAAGIKFFNTNDVTVTNSDFNRINAFNIWNDTTNNTKIIGNEVTDVGDSFKRPSFNNQTEIAGIYNEKSLNAIVKDNKVTTIDDFVAFRSTEFSMKTLQLDNNDFSNVQLGTTDYWVKEAAEKLVASEPNPEAANFSLFAEEYTDASGYPSSVTLR